MSYTINNYDGTLLTTIVDYTKDTTTSLTLPGPNFGGYGQYLNENLVYLLENFAGNTAPAGTNLQGQLWFNKSTQTLEVFTTQGYVPVSGVILQNSQPVNVIAGTTWYDTGHNQYYMFDGTTWNLIGPNYTKQEGVSGAIPAVLNDTSNVPHNVLLLQFGTIIFGILNGDPSFTATPAISGFPTIFRGLTLNNNLFPGNNQFYTNANAAAYLPTDPTIIGINNSLANLSTSLITTNANIVSANTAMTSYVNSQILSTNTAWQANAQSQETEISNLNSLVTLVNGNLAVVNSAWQANAAAQQITLNSLSSTVLTLAPINSPTFTGSPQAPTPALTDASNLIATTSFVKSLITGATNILGTMSTQNSSNVSITGGSILGSYALNAATATYASSAGSATTATNANNATHANIADLATTSTNATHASSADSATFATNATYASSANVATSATTATNAVNATTADSATFASTATHANIADSATTATTASYATTAGSATTASYATTAGSATTAGNGGVTSVNGHTGAVTLKGLGLSGESWQSVSRSFNTQYTNSHTYPIAVSATASAAVTSEIQGYVNGTLVSFFQWQFNGNGSYGGCFMIVPPGATYQLNSGQSVYNWVELF